MCTMKINEKLNGVELKFDVKPAQEILDLIKSVGFRWSSRQKIWYALQNENTLTVAEKLVNGITKECNTSTGEMIAKTTKKSKKEKTEFSLWEVTHVQIKEHTEEEIQAIGGVKEIAKIIRKELKAFEGFKFSVRTEDNYYGGRISVYVLSSPYDKESKYMQAVIKHIDSLINSYRYCTNYDPYGDYGSSYNLFGYVRVGCDYTQTDADVTNIIVDYDIKKEIEKQRQLEEREHQFQEHLKEEAIRKAEYEKREQERLQSIETISNNVTIKDVDAYYVVGGQWANINKNDTLQEYETQVNEGNYYTRVSEVTRELHFNKETFDLFSNNLLSDYDFLQNMGGSKTTDERIKSMIDYNKMTKEERDTVEWIDSECVAVYCDNELMFIINPEGSSYARYIGLIGENTQLLNEYLTEKKMTNEEINALSVIAHEMEIISNEVIKENDINDTWFTSNWTLYRKEITKKLHNDNIDPTIDVIRQIDNIDLKDAMYRLVEETDSLQEQFVSANLQEGDKITAVYINDLGMLQVYPMIYIKHELTNFAQYNDAVKVIINLPHKKGMYSKTFYKDVIIYKGNVTIPNDLLNSVYITENGIEVTKGLFSSCDTKQYDVIINHFKSQGILPIINTYKPIF